ncbi:NHSL1 protein, partial [Rhinopomastus cyanomelas]|nr:NHSL1 protein [Rhinopomastus cyanomelas]
MPFYRRRVVARRVSSVPLSELRDVCGRAALSVLRQLAELCGHSLALLGDIEGHVLALDRRTGRLHRRTARLQALLRGRGLPATATSNLDLESKKMAHAKLPWQQPVNVFLAGGRPPGMEQLHQEAQLNLQSLLQGLGEDVCVPSRASPTQPPNQRTTEEETSGTTVLSAHSPDASLSLPTSPDKPPGWGRAFPLPTVEEKQWHQSCSIQTNIVPINVS